jgi:hypothetical protein
MAFHEHLYRSWVTALITILVFFFGTSEVILSWVHHFFAHAPPLYFPRIPRLYVQYHTWSLLQVCIRIHILVTTHGLHCDLSSIHTYISLYSNAVESACIDDNREIFISASPHMYKYNHGGRQNDIHFLLHPFITLFRGCSKVNFSLSYLTYR